MKVRELMELLEMVQDKQQKVLRDDESPRNQLTVLIAVEEELLDILRSSEQRIAVPEVREEQLRIWRMKRDDKKRFLELSERIGLI